MLSQAEQTAQKLFKKEVDKLDIKNKESKESLYLTIMYDMEYQIAILQGRLLKNRRKKTLYLINILKRVRYLALQKADILGEYDMS